MKIRDGIGILLVAVGLLWALNAWAQATDSFSSYGVGLTSLATRAFAIVPHDTNELTAVTRAIWVGGAGNIVVVTSGGDTVTLTGALVGTVINVRVKIVKATDTTATFLVGLY